jgi:ABC-type transport system substrate-binding protein
MDGLIARLVRSLSPGERRDAFNRVQTIWAREMPAIPTVAPNVLVAWARGVGNLKPSVLPPHLLWNAEELTVQPE